MKGLDTKNLYHYKVTVEYKEGYFDDPNHPRKHELNYFSTSQRDKAHIQKCYPNGVVLDVELVKAPN